VLTPQQTDYRETSRDITVRNVKDVDLDGNMELTVSDIYQATDPADLAAIDLGPYVDQTAQSIYGALGSYLVRQDVEISSDFSPLGISANVLSFTRQVDTSTGVMQESWSGTETQNTYQSNGSTLKKSRKENFKVAIGGVGGSGLVEIEQAVSVKDWQRTYTDYSIRDQIVFDTSGQNIKSEIETSYLLAEDPDAEPLMRFESGTDPDGMLGESRFEVGQMRATESSQFNALGKASRVFEFYQSPDGQLTDASLTETTFNRGRTETRTTTSFIYRDSDGDQVADVWNVTAIDKNTTLAWNDLGSEIETISESYIHEEALLPDNLVIPGPSSQAEGQVHLGSISSLNIINSGKLKKIKERHTHNFRFDQNQRVLASRIYNTIFEGDISYSEDSIDKIVG